MECIFVMITTKSYLWDINSCEFTTYPNPNPIPEDFGEKNLKFFFDLLPVQLVSLHPVMIMYWLQDTIGCNINRSYYSNTTIYIQYLPSRLFLCLE